MSHESRPFYPQESEPSTVTNPLARWMKETAKGVVVAIAAMGVPSHAEAAPGVDVPVTRDFGASEHTSNFDLADIGVEGNFFGERLNSQGESEVTFEPLSLLLPLQLELPHKEHGTHEVRFTLPYEYSRLFNSAKPLRPEDHKKVTQYIEGELRKQMADELIGFDFTRDAYAFNHSEEGVTRINGVDILSLQITGTTSPEGHQSLGSDTSIPGNIDPENISLGTERAAGAVGDITESIRNVGLDSELGAEPTDLGGAEIQFTDAEVDELIALSSDQPGFDEWEKIHNLVVQYNDGKVGDPSIQERLNEIIAAKRGVEVTIEYKNAQKDVTLIPLPLLPLLGLSLAFAWKRRRKEGPVSGEPPVKPVEPIKIFEVDVPETLRTTDLPEPGTPEWNNFEEQTVLDDLCVYYSNAETKKMGIDYPHMVAEMSQEQDNTFRDASERELYWTDKLLSAWASHDRLARQKAGVSQEQLDVGLNYHEQPKQIQWAKMHVRVLLEMADSQRGEEILQDKARKLFQKRMDRNMGK